MGRRQQAFGSGKGGGGRALISSRHLATYASCAAYRSTVYAHCLQRPGTVCSLSLGRSAKNDQRNSVQTERVTETIPGYQGRVVERSLLTRKVMSFLCFGGSYI